MNNEDDRAAGARDHQAAEPPLRQRLLKKCAEGAAFAATKHLADRWLAEHPDAVERVESILSALLDLI